MERFLFYKCARIRIKTRLQYVKGDRVRKTSRSVGDQDVNNLFVVDITKTKTHTSMYARYMRVVANTN